MSLLRPSTGNVKAISAALKTKKSMLTRLGLSDVDEAIKGIVVGLNGPPAADVDKPEAGFISNWYGYKVFWQQLQSNPKYAALFVDSLLAELFRQIAWDAEKAKNDKKGRQTQEVAWKPIGRASLFNTLEFCFLVLNIDEKMHSRGGATPMPHAAKLQDAKFMSTHIKLEPRLAEVKNWFDSRATPNESLTDRADLITYPNEGNRYELTNGFGNLEGLQLESGREAFGFFLYHMQMHIPERRAEMANSLISHLEHLAGLDYKSMDYDNKVRDVLGLLILGKQLMQYSPLPTSIISKLDKYVQKYCFWPAPVGDMAIRFLKLIKSEQHFPGFAMRRRVRYESSQAVFHSSVREERTQALHILATHSLDNILCMLETVDAKDIVVVNNRLPSKAIAASSVLATLMANGGGFGPVTEGSAKLCAADEKTVTSTEEYIVTIEHMVEQEPNLEVCHEVIKQGVERIMEIITDLAPAESHDLHLASDCAPGLAPMLHVAHYADPVDLQEALENPGSDRPIVAAGEPLDRLRDLVEQVRVLLTGSEHRPSIEDYASDNSTRQVVLPIVIAGGTLELQEVTRAYVNLVEEFGQMLGGIRLQFYILPTKPNALSAFFAAHDPWYRRNIYMPCHPGFIVPWPKDDHARTQPIDNSELTPPGHLIQQSLNALVRGARCVTEIQLFNIEIWKDKKESGMSMIPSICLPFVSAVYFGARAAAKKSALIYI